MEQQIDIEGRLNDVPERHEAPRLFVPAPTQLPGQTFLDDDELEIDPDD